MTGLFEHAWNLADALLAWAAGIVGVYVFAWIGWQAHVWNKFEKLHAWPKRIAEADPQDIFILEAIARQREFCAGEALRRWPLYWLRHWRDDYDTELLAGYRREVLGK
jgi:hypothetical protein